MKKIIAFAGVKGSGKTTAFKTLNENLEGFSELMIAGHLKDTCAKVFSMEDHHFHDQNYKERVLEIPIILDETNITSIIKEFGYTPDYNTHVRHAVGKIFDTPRKLLQFIGTELLQTVNKEVHLLNLLKETKEDKISVVTDMRFPHEFEYFKNHPDCEFHPFFIDNKKAEALAASDTHASERRIFELKNECIVIDNNSSLEEFRDHLINSIKKVV